MNDDLSSDSSAQELICSINECQAMINDLPTTAYGLKIKVSVTTPLRYYSIKIIINSTPVTVCTLQSVPWCQNQMNQIIMY